MRYSKSLLAAGLAALVMNIACTRDPQKLKVEYLAAGDKYMAQNQVNEAIISYRNAVAQDAMYAAARVKLAAAYKISGDKGNAMREAIRAADLLPNDVNAQVEAGKWLLDAGQFAEARNRATNILAKQPKNVDGLVLLGNSLVGLQDIDGAIKQLEEAVEADPHRTLTYRNLGFLQMAKGSAEQAENSLKRAVEVEPENVVAHLSLANFYWASGKLQDAEREIKVAVDLDPKGAESNKTMTALLFSLNRLADAEPYLEAYAAASKEIGPQLVLADFYISLNRPDEGIALIKTLANRPDGFIPATLRLASVEFKAGRFDQAYQMIDSVLQKDAKNEDARLVKSRLLVSQQRASEAVAILRPLVSENPQSVGGHLILATALEGTNEYGAAIDEYKQVLQLEPSSPVALIRLSDLYFRQGDVNAAAEFIGQVVKNRPGWLTARVLYARSLIALNNVQRAEQELNYLQQVQPKSSSVQKLRGDLMFARRNYPAARAAYEKAAELDPTAFEAFTGMVRVDLVQKKPDSARARIEARLATSPNDQNTQMLAGNAYMLLGDAKRAEEAYKRVIEIDNTAMEAYASLGSVYMLQNRLPEARAEFERAAAHEPSKLVAAKTMVGVIFSMEGRHNEARSQYEKVLQIDASAPVAANNLAWYYASGGKDNLDMALQLAQTAKTKLATNAQVNDTLGWIYYKKGLTTMALKPLSEAAKTSPSDPVILYHLGMAQLEAKQTRQARESLERALKLKSDFDGANEARQALASLSR